jgi:hypothetical protein
MCGMLELAHDLRFGQETFESLLCACALGGENFERFLLVPNKMAGAVHHPHAAAADLAQ